MIRCLRDVTGHVQQEDPEGQQHDDADLDLLSGSAEEDRQQQYRRQDRRQDDVQDVERVTSTYEDAEGDVGELLVRTAGVGELLPIDHRVQHFPLAVRAVGVHVDDVTGVGQIHLGRVIGPRSEHQLANLNHGKVSSL